jgi:predicted ATPase
MEFSRLPIRSVSEHPLQPADRHVWPATIPAVAQLLDDGLELGTITVLLGDNGTGKSTMVEAIATAYGLSPEGGSPNAMHVTRPSESPLSDHIQLLRNAGASKFGYFLRAETMHGLYTYLEGVGGRSYHELSHGESFLELIRDRFKREGLWVLDEPESALSFSGCMALLAHLIDLVDGDRNQVILSTHSPLLAAIPGATIYEVGEWGIRPCAWDDTDLVRIWRSFLDGPDRFLRHIVSES